MAATIGMLVSSAPRPECYRGYRARAADVNAEDITVVELTRDSGVSQSATSQHLRSLKQSGLIRARRRGRNTHYRAQAEGLAPLVDWLSVYGLFWRDRFDRLKKLLKEIDR